MERRKPIQVDIKIWRKIKIKSARENKSMGKVIKDLVDYLEKAK